MADIGIKSSDTYPLKVQEVDEWKINWTVDVFGDMPDYFWVKAQAQPAYVIEEEWNYHVIKLVAAQCACN